MEKQLKRELAEFIGLSNEEIKVVFCNIGASIVSLFTKDKNGEFADIVLGYQNPEDYDQFGCYFGAVCGRVANRIAKGRFELNSQSYQLDINNGINHLHGGETGLSTKLFTYDLFTDKVVFKAELVDGESGYPGNGEVTVTYTLKGSDLIIDYQASCDADTLINLTNHSYFNLNGHDQGNILEHYLTINGDYFLAIDKDAIPLGEKTAVKQTPFDFRVAKKIGQDINSEHLQIKYGNGYDHSFCVQENAACLYSEESGRVLEVITTCEGMQLYSGNFIDKQSGKDCIYEKYGGVALETQYHPDAINQKLFKKPILEKGEQYQEQTIFRFSVKQ